MDVKKSSLAMKSEEHVSPAELEDFYSDWGGALNGTLNTAHAASLTATYKRMPEMPPEQRAKILAMHRDSRANAGMYVAVVLAVYVILLTILLCRYARRQRFTEDSDEEIPGGLLQSSFRKLRRLTAFLCCVDTMSSSHPLAGDDHPCRGLPLPLETTEFNVIANAIAKEQLQCTTCV